VLRARISDVKLEAEPPGWLIPPLLGESLKPIKSARARVVCFSIRVRTGLTL